MTITLFAAIAATALAAPLVRNANAQGGPTVRPTVEAAAATRWTIIHATKLRTKEPFTAHYDAKSTSTAAPATRLDARGDGMAEQSSEGVERVNQMSAWMRSLADAFSAWGTGH